MEKIFDPSADTPWPVYPLTGATTPENGLAFDTGDVITDPDRIAQDYPFHYQQATIRQYLEMMIAAGDAAYEKCTQERLQESRLIYVPAKQLFGEELPELLQTLTNQTWPNPSLSEAAGDDFAGLLLPITRRCSRSLTGLRGDSPTSDNGSVSTESRRMCRFFPRRSTRNDCSGPPSTNRTTTGIPGWNSRQWRGLQRAMSRT